MCQIISDTSPVFYITTEAMRKSIHLCLVMMLIAAGSLYAQKHNVVFRYTGNGADSVVYRIPAIATLNDGRLLAIADYRHCGSDIGYGRIDLHQSISADGGKTWSQPAPLTDISGMPVSQGTGKGTTESSMLHPDCGYGDAAIAADRDSERVILLAVCGRTPFFRAHRNNPNQIARWRSNDGGRTWTGRDTITSEIYGLFDGRCGDSLKAPGGCVDALFFGSGRIMQSRHVKTEGTYRIYAALSGRHIAHESDTDSIGTYIANWVLYSDDFGEKWHVLGRTDIPPVSIGGDEPKVEELPDGSVLLSARSSNSYGRRFNIFRYSNAAKAKGEWIGLPVMCDFGGINPNPCNGEILILPVIDNHDPGNTDAWIALQSITLSNKRENVGIKWKPLLCHSDYADAKAMAQSWGEIQSQTLKITTKPSAYSTMAQTTDGHIAFLFEESTYGKDYSIVFKDLTLEEITGGRFSAR